MPAKKDFDQKYRDHFAKLLVKYGKRPKDFRGEKIPLNKRIGRGTYYAAWKGKRPVKPDVIANFAELMGCSVEEFLKPLAQGDWVRPDVGQFLGKFQLLAMDSSIVLHPFAEQEVGRGTWFPSEIKLEIDEPAVAASELKEFSGVIKDWKQRNPNANRGIKYCVTKIVSSTEENNPTVTVKVRPIEWHLARPIGELLGKSYQDTENAFDQKTPEAQFRRDHFPELHRRNQPPFPNMLAAVMSVVSSDEKLLLFGRSDETVDYSRGCWSASIDEHFNANWQKYLGSAKGYSPLSKTDQDIADGLRRCATEELKLSPDIAAQTKFQVLGFGIEFEVLNTNILALARVPQRAEKILSNPDLKSHREFDCFAYCNFDLETLRPVILDKTKEPKEIVSPGKIREQLPKEWKWDPTSRMRIYLSLAHQFGKAAVDADLLKG